MYSPNLQVYFAPQQLCGAAEGAQPNGRADECVNGVLFASTDLGTTFKFRGLIGRVAGLAPNISARAFISNQIGAVEMSWLLSLLTSSRASIQRIRMLHDWT